MTDFTNESTSGYGDDWYPESDAEGMQGAWLPDNAVQHTIFLNESNNNRSLYCISIVSVLYSFY